MLEYLRNMSGKPVAKILMGVLIFSFVGWGVAEWVLSGTMTRGNKVVQVGSQTVDIEQFNNARARELSTMSRAEQKEVYSNPVAANQFLARVVSDLTNNLMVEQHAQKLGFVVTDKRVAREIKSYPEFQDGGSFSAQRFDFYLSNMGMTERAFADYLRLNIMRSMVLGPIAFAPVVPEFAVTATYNARYGERKIDYVAVNYDNYKVGTPTEDQLREYYAKNPKMNPETRSVSYVLVPARMEQPDLYDAAYANAQKLEDAIISGESMKDAAAKLKAKHASFKAFTASNAPRDEVLTDQMIARVFTMDAGLESEIIETKSGFVILVVDKVNPAAAADFETVKKDLVNGWKSDEQKKSAYLRANELLVDLNAGKGLNGKKTATVSRTNGAPMELLNSVFAVDVGTNTIVSGKNTFYVLHVESEIAPKVDNVRLKNVRDEMQKNMSRDMMEDYSSYLYRTYPVKVNTKTLDRLSNRN